MADEGMEKERRIARLRASRCERSTLTHGLYLNTLWPCNRCAYKDSCADYIEGGECIHEQDLIGQRQLELSRLPGIDGVEDHAQIASICWLDLLIQRGFMFLARTTGGGWREGPKGVEAIPATRELARLIKIRGGEVERLMEMPIRRAKMEMVTGGPGSELTRAIIASEAEADDEEAD